MRRVAGRGGLNHPHRQSPLMSTVVRMMSMHSRYRQSGRREPLYCFPKCYGRPVLSTAACTAPEVDRSVLTCDLDLSPGSGTIADRVSSAVVLDSGSRVRLAGGPRPGWLGG